MAIASALSHMTPVVAWALSPPALAWALCVTVLALALGAGAISVGYGAALYPPAIPSACTCLDRSEDAVADWHAAEHQR